MLTRRTLLTASAAGFVLCGLGLVAPAWASIESDAKELLVSLGNRAIKQLADKSVSDNERMARFRSLLLEAVDFPLISQQVLGKYWRGADDATRQEFQAVLRETLIQRFLPLFDGYRGETFEVASTRTSSKDPTVVAATTNVFAPNGEMARVEWYMKQHSSGLKIYDFSAEGIRLTISLQDEYNTVLRQSGGDVAALTAALKKKLPPTAVLD